MKMRDSGLVLASSSSYRAGLLRRLVDDFDIVASAVDESALAAERPKETAIRLAAAKARAVATSLSGRLIIGSDQVAELDGRPVGKPGTTGEAMAQLTRCSGKTMDFHTAVCVLDTRKAPAGLREACDTTRVQFRLLAEPEIRRYLERDRPFDCAGSFKAEQRGISLFESIETTDPSALIGLPLIALGRLLRGAGLSIP